MKENKFRLIPVIMTAALILLAVGSEVVYLGDFELRFRTRKFNRVLREKEKIMEDCINGMKPILAGGENYVSSPGNNLFSTAVENRITILYYFGNKLDTWSDNEFDVPSELNDTIYSSPLVFIQNGWFLTKTIRSGNERIVGLLRLRSDYGFENDIISNGFLKEFGISSDVGFSRDENSSEFRVYAGDGTFLFCLLFPEVKDITYFILVPLFLWILAFFLLINLTLEFVKHLVRQDRNGLAITSCGLIFLAVYLVIIITRKPAVFFLTELFSPYRYTMNALIPSLGHLLILSVLLAVLSFVIYSYITINERQRKNRFSDFVHLLLFLVPGALLFALYHMVFSHLVFNSTINFETFKVLDLNIFSLTGFILLALLFTLPLLYIIKVFKVFRQFEKVTVIRSVVASSLIFIVLFFRMPEMLVSLVLYYFLITAGIWFYGKTRTGMFSKTVIFALVFGLYSVFLITFLSEKKTEENLKIQLVTYSTENDPYAEHLLLDMWPQISRDSILRQMMDVEYFEKNDVDRISDYLHVKYFAGYWGNFNFTIVPCRKEDSLYIADRNDVFEDCFSFFDSKVRDNGTQLTGTGFYFMDNNLGRSNYLGRVVFNYERDRTRGLFIDLYSDVNVFQPGYSELLLDKKYHSYTRLKEYSFAKYINGEIVLSTGDFAYDKNDAGYIDKVADYRLFRAESFRHVLYRNGNVTVMISKPAISAQDVVISYAYLIAFIIIFANLLLLITKKPELKTPASLNFRQKLQVSFIGILLFSFALVGSVIVSMAIKQYQTKHYENLKEKLNSVYTELENRISADTYLASGGRSSDYSSLNDILVRLSNIFNTDINLYDQNGYLVATSRPEIFYRNLTSRRMNIMAFSNLANLTRSEFFQKEKIGKLDYISGYRTFYNTDNKILAFLNLPYFRMQSVLAKEISNMMVAVINFTLLLIVIAMSLAVFISGRLTAPLALLSSRLASVQLGRKSEHLSYKGNDEVGDLVKQYNLMVDELDESAQKLARSERESAWREMAKQIAHEIKNPLTPMKLNVQQLLKSWKDGVPGFEKKLEKFTRNQIEYINNLSSIASAFSSFAKIPEPVPVTVDLIEQIKTTVELFKNTDNISFRFGLPHAGKIFIYADREQINGVFSNLIKNSIQSIPADREGIIRVSLETGNRKVVVSIADNGSGIPDSLKNKMFTPNFTTKSSGTGLGLSIVKRYVEGAGGRVWFESEEEKGSVFFVEFPLLDSQDEAGSL